MLTRDVSKRRDQKRKWANETKMCSFARLLVSLHGTLASAFCWLSIAPVFLQWQTSGPFCLIVGGRIIGSRSNARNGASRQPFHKGRGVLTLQLHILHSRAYLETVLPVLCCTMAETRCRGGFEFSQNFQATWEFYFFILIWLSHLALTTLFQLRFGWK